MSRNVNESEYINLVEYAQDERIWLVALNKYNRGHSDLGSNPIHK